MEREFEGRVALVTGAAGVGIGQTVARRLAAGGATVIVTDSHERRTKEVAEAISRDYEHTTVAGFAMDVTDRARVAEVLAEVDKTFGPVQILVNNAAWNVMGDFFTYDPADWDRVLEVDLTGPFNTARLALPGMRAAGGGAIVNVSSVGADQAKGEGELPYAVAKGGLNTLTRGLAKVGGPFKIRCNAVAMGMVSGTKFADARPEIMEQYIPEIPLGRPAKTTDVAEAVAFLASERAGFITGEILNVSGGWYMRN